MPRNVRNFWLELDIDGRKSAVKTGPVRKDGGFYLRILVRENGSISNKEVIITGNANDGKLVVEGYVSGDDENGFRLETER